MRKKLRALVTGAAPPKNQRIQKFTKLDDPLPSDSLPAQSIQLSRRSKAMPVKIRWSY